ncbi:PREDICTED: uncharacterized protein LOC108367286 [Rhagoletis zephyria]|uniref:uncharacterized protein LOC108367286 n=1 Tax=Rhagoletis zephyria TaxID=28612 RepID=UPI0008118A88|nr:PREDICTED: uncharacterized protein LOC108367286 [Rhagoletis zephyria]
MSESIEALIKLQLNRFAALEKILANFKKDSTARKTKPYFQQRLSRIDDLNSEFCTTHKLIVCSDIAEDDGYFREDVASQFEEMHLDLFCLLTQRQEEMYPRTIPPDEPLPSNLQNRNTSSIKLPRLPVPSFSGRFTEWPSFHDSFNRLIHQNIELNSIQKFHYLKQALPADRDVDIHQMLLTEVNYDTAWDLLLKRYNNPRILFSQHMNTLYNLPQLYKEKSDNIKSMLNVANVCVNEFKRLKIPIGGCDHWVAHYLATKLPTDTHTAWERHLGSKTDIPTFGELEAFLNTRIFTIDAIENRSMTFTASSAVKSPKDTKHQTPFNYNNSKPIQRSIVNVKSFHAAPNVNTAQVESCALCGQAHIIRRCPTFLSKDCYERKAIVDKAKLCLNCLSKAHALSKCTSIKNCLQCGQRHHTLLHFPFATKTTPANNALTPSTQRVLSNFSNVSAPPQEQSVPISSNTPLSTAVLEARRFTRAHSTLAANSTQLGVDRIPVQGPRHILLATASVVLCNEITNRSAIVHALIDQGSEGTLITENAVQQLGLQRHPTAADICGVGPNLFSQSRSLVSCTLRSCHDEHFAAHIESAYVLKQLTAPLPSQEIVPQDMAHLRGLALADPKYYQPKRIDLIIGADMIAQILEPETRIGHVNQPIAQNTHLGWILSGRINSDTPSTVTIRCHHSNLELEGLVRKFFENEHVPTSVPMSAQDQWCEDFFRSTYTRQANGKYLVRLPL